MPETIAVVDYGAGNLRSVAKALEHVAPDARIVITGDAREVHAADRILLPGVGAFGACMNALRALPDMIDTLDETVRGANPKPFLGICVGMQLMAERGEENGLHDGLGWVAGTVRRIEGDAGLRVPHMGWSRVTAAGPVVTSGDAYFAHSYAVEDTDATVAVTDYGGERVAAVHTGTAIGVQFHPEKSQGYGLGVLERWCKWRP